MIHRGTYDGTIYYNPANKFCIISVKTAEKDVPEEARSIRRRKDHLIRFVATGYELPRTDAVELELDGEWKKGKYGMQLQVEQWHEIVPQTNKRQKDRIILKPITSVTPARSWNGLKRSWEKMSALFVRWRWHWGKPVRFSQTICLLEISAAVFSR